jgi:hypothetical protein
MQHPERLQKPHVGMARGPNCNLALFSTAVMIQLKIASPIQQLHQQKQAAQKQPLEKSSGLHSVKLKYRENVMHNDKDEEETGFPLNYILLSPFCSFFILDCHLQA